MSALVAKLETSLDLTGQTSAYAQTNIFTPAQNGLFRLNVYVFQPSAGGATVNFRVDFEDDQGARNLQKSAGLGDSVHDAFVFWAKTTTAISVRTTISGSPNYDLHLALESLT